MVIWENVHADVGILFPAAVNAMSMAVFMLVILAPSMRVNVRRCVCASTTAMLLEIMSDKVYSIYVGRPYIGTPISIACCSAACTATRAPPCVRVGSEIVADIAGAM